MNIPEVIVVVHEGRVIGAFTDADDISFDVIDLDDADASSDDVCESEYKKVEELSRTHKTVY